MTDETSAHPRFRWLVDLDDGALSGARREQVQAHLSAGCTRCRGTAETIAALRRSLADGPLEPVPAAVLRRARGLYAAGRARGTAEIVRGVLARLVFDQRRQPALALRSDPGTSRRLLWAFEGRELYASITMAGGRADLRGRVLLEQDDGVSAVVGEVRVAPADGDGKTARLDAGGGFAFTGLRPGAYSLSGEVDGAAFRTPPFVVD